MSDHTPTTEEVRNVYVEVSDNADFPSWRHADEHKAAGGGRAEFDRWLAEVERAAAEKAWDVGHAFGAADQKYRGGHAKPSPNPYRKGSSDE